MTWSDVSLNHVDDNFRYRSRVTYGKTHFKQETRRCLGSMEACVVEVVARVTYGTMHSKQEMRHRLAFTEACVDAAVSKPPPGGAHSRTHLKEAGRALRSGPT